MHYYMVCFAYYTELNLQICNYAQKRHIGCENCKYTIDKKFYGYFCDIYAPLPMPNRVNKGCKMPHPPFSQWPKITFSYWYLQYLHLAKRIPKRRAVPQWMLCGMLNTCCLRIYMHVGDTFWHCQKNLYILKQYLHFKKYLQCQTIFAFTVLHGVLFKLLISPWL